MTEQKKILKRSDILRTMADRATDKFGMMIALSFGICVPFVVMLFAANWIWSDFNRLAGFVFGIIPCGAIPVLLAGGLKQVYAMHKKRKSILQGDVTIMTDVMTEIRQCEETRYNYSTHRMRKYVYDVFEFARGNTFTMKAGLWTHAEKKRARDQFGVGESFILVVYQNKSWELQMIYPEALYEYVDDSTMEEKDAGR